MTVTDAPVLDLGVGQVSGPAPSALRDLLADALEPPFNTYAPHLGLPGARLAVARSLDVNPSGVVMTTGASGAFLAFLLVARPRRPRPRILLPDPCYPAFLNTCRRMGIEVDTYPAPDSRIDLEAFEQGLSDQTIGAVVVSPGNPTGVVTHADDVRAAEHLAATSDVPLVLDESYGDLVDPAHPQARLEMLHERSVRLRSFSKCYALSGHRAGALVGAPATADLYGHAHFAALMSAPTPGQVLAAGCLDPAVGAPFLERTRTRLVARHAVLREAVADVAGFEADASDVGVFGWIRGPLEGGELARRLGTAGIVVVPGAAFGSTCSDHVRVLADVPEGAVERFVAALGRAVEHD